VSGFEVFGLKYFVHMVSGNFVIFTILINKLLQNFIFLKIKINKLIFTSFNHLCLFDFFF